MKKISLWGLLGLLAFLCLFPFTQWKALDDLRFDIIDSLARLKFYTLSSYTSSGLSQKIKAPAPEWAQAQMEEDLQNGATSKQALDQFMQSLSMKELQDEHLLIRFTVKDNKIETYPKTLHRFQGRLEAFKKAMDILHKEGHLPEGLDFVLCINDKIFDSYEGAVPIFVFSKNLQDKKQSRTILIPDGMNLSRWAYIYPTIQFANFVFPWKSKFDKAFWRGSNTNPSRVVLASMAQQLDYIDAALTDGRGGTYMIPEYQIQYKYLPSLDGISATWPGLLWKLASNSVVMKQDSSHFQWYYCGLKPWVHYVPLKRDLSDMEQQYAWAQSHEKDAICISENARSFVKENLQYEDMLHYMARVLKAYHQKYVVKAV